MQASKRSNGFPLYLMPVLSALVLCVGPLRGPKLVRQYVFAKSIILSWYFPCAPISFCRCCVTLTNPIDVNLQARAILSAGLDG